MRIEPIFQNISSHKIYKNNFCGRFNYSTDVFIKNVFNKEKEDNSYNQFLSWALRTDFISQISEIIDKTGTILGSGFEGTTYSIPGNDNWVIKQDKRGGIIQIPTEKPEIIEIKDKAPSLNLGQKIAYVIIPLWHNSSRKIYILKKQKGTSYGVDYNHNQAKSLYNENIHIDALKIAASLPVSSYKKMIQDVLYANSLGYEFDNCNPNNIMIDNKNKSINFVDVADSSEESVEPQLADILYLLLDGAYGLNFNSSDTDKSKKEEAKQLSYQIIEKFYSAADILGIKFNSTEELDKIIKSLL